jgi:hypothetical protein
LTKPLSPFLRGFKKRPSQDQDRVVRKNEETYEDKGYDPEAVEREAEVDNQVARRLGKKKRGLKGITPGKPDWF